MSSESGTESSDAAHAEWDVFVSHSHTDEMAATHIATALAEAGLSVFRAIGSLDAFTSISDVVMRALRSSKILLACYSAHYLTRPACQHEFATAYLAGQAEGNPLGRVAAVNLEHSPDHVQPRQLRDILLPGLSTSGTAALVEAVAGRVAAAPGPMGDIPDRQPRWLGTRPVHPPSAFAGRWSELWWLHSALHPHLGPLTSAPSTPIVVVHGAGGTGKTALAAAYVRRFGAVYPGGIFWASAHGPGSGEPPPRPDCLWVVDDAAGDIESVRALLPRDPHTPCLLLTRDGQLSTLGNSMRLGDLTADDSALLVATHAPSIAGSEAALADIADITAFTAGSPALRARVAGLADTLGTGNALNRLHGLSPSLLRPVEQWLAPELAAIDECAWDVLRALTAASPTSLSILRIADILAAVRGSDRISEVVAVQRAASDLLARGVLPGMPDDVELTLPHAVALAARRLDRDATRAEQVRAATLRTHTRPDRIEDTSRAIAVPGHPYDDEQRRAAYRIQTELVHRITGHPLDADQGSLREALNSLHTLLEITRTTQGAVHPAAFHDPPAATRRLDDIADHLINDILRNTLTRWHVRLSAHEDMRPPGISRIAHERNWSEHDQLRQELTDLHARALAVAAELGTITGNAVDRTRRPARLTTPPR